MLKIWKLYNWSWNFFPCYSFVYTCLCISYRWKTDTSIASGLGKCTTNFEAKTFFDRISKKLFHHYQNAFTSQLTDKPRIYNNLFCRFTSVKNYYVLAIWMINYILYISLPFHFFFIFIQNARYNVYTHENPTFQYSQIYS